MLKKIVSLFQSKPKENTQNPKLEVEGVEAYFNKELNACELISKDKYSIVMQHLLHESKLKVEDISRIFGAPREQAQKINAAINVIYCKATITRAWDDNLYKCINAEVKKFSLSSAITNEDCEWCKSILGKELELDSTTKAMFEKNCQCKPYRKSFIQPKIEF
ncbi:MULTISPECIES: hypothetical protein [unclassified Pseudoalteromonas]|uniref:hypothetical protein n=1 Tax=unclassified Pseudoalteromonas TaxID=194690 RepID=UPI001602DCC9|nr:MULTISPECIES: hypothetical protein [unclassified Pseudoalteromonas]MBB1336212.1 hypothetical protein [Pseudoalteromonas sp. SR44-2]MBG9991061.1 hypothetical protein [Pseudoalteromonas sp. NZS37]